MHDRHPTCCHPEDELEIALQLMPEKRVRRLPVVNERMQLVGMISISDFVRAQAGEAGSIYGALKEISERSARLSNTKAGTYHAA